MILTKDLNRYHENVKDEKDEVTIPVSRFTMSLFPWVAIVAFTWVKVLYLFDFSYFFSGITTGSMIRNVVPFSAELLQVRFPPIFSIML